MISAIFGAAFFVLCLQAAIKDTLSLKITNGLNLSIAVLFIPAAFAAQIGWSAAGAHVVVGLIAFVVSYLLFAFRLFGGGDAKMIPAVLLWVGPAGWLHFVYSMALSGGLLAIVILLARKTVPADLAPGFAQNIMNKENGIPYGVAIMAGAFFAAPHSDLLNAFLNQFSVFG
ncbi:MAG: prepilin peptidase [Hyphomonadaceae bacterium]